MAYPSNRREKKPKPVITDISDAMIGAYGDDLAELDQQIRDLQDAKKRVYATVREDHGKKAAKSLKIAVTVHGLTSEKRAEAEEIDAEAQRMLAIIERGTRIANSDSAHVARGAREPDHDHDPVTGEIIESAAADEATLTPVKAGQASQQGGEGGEDAPALSVDTESTAARKDVHTNGDSGEGPFVCEGHTPAENHRPHRTSAEPGESAQEIGNQTPPAGTQAPPVDTHSSAMTQALDDEASNPGLTGGEGAQPAVPANSITVVPGGKHIPHHGVVRA